MIQVAKVIDFDFGTVKQLKLRFNYVSSSLPKYRSVMYLTVSRHLNAELLTEPNLSASCRGGSTELSLQTSFPMCSSAHCMVHLTL